jgi:putative transposase
LESLQIERPKKEKENLCLDKAYDSHAVRQFLKSLGLEPHIRGRGEEKKAKKEHSDYRARRWVVERTHSWLNKFRRIFIRWERKEENYRAMLHLACGIIVWRLSGLLG